MSNTASYARHTRADLVEEIDRIKDALYAIDEENPDQVVLYLEIARDALKMLVSMLVDLEVLDVLDRR
jgi:hypothetical protein